jgi:hypothetical protein
MDEVGMKRSAIYGVTLALAGLSASGRAATPDAEIVLQNDSPYAVFVRTTDNNTTPPAGTVPVRLDPGIGVTVPADLDGDGNYYISWTATDPVDPPTKQQSGSCRGQRDAICYVDLSNATPLAPPPLPPAAAPKP